MPKKADPRCDNRLTVIEAIPWGRKFTRIEAWATQAGHGIVRLRFSVHGHPAIEFGQLVAFEVPGYASLYGHEDAPGESFRIRGEVKELGPIQEAA